MTPQNIWGLILAAGDGTRLRSLTTTPGGLAVPKQFCSLHGGASLLEEALARAESVTQRCNILTVVADQHRRWWRRPLQWLPHANTIIQPKNRGTAAGLLLPLLHIVQRDPSGTVVVLPSDHFVRNEIVLAEALREATRMARADHQYVYFLGMVPDEADPELGYIVPGGRTSTAAASVRRFVEKPPLDIARALVHAGALWNAFIVAASARALLGLYANRYSELISQMTCALEQDEFRPDVGRAVQQLYHTLPTLDFSRDVLQGQECALRVLAVPECGWSDLGTPQRVAETLNRYGIPYDAARGALGAPYLNLADQQP